MKLLVTHPNYCATVVKVHHLLPLENCDNVVAFPIFGFQAIVGKDTHVGELGVLFTAETQLSEEFCSRNNLFRNATLNRNPECTGYIEDNRRVKAVKFRGHRSDALYLPLSTIGITGLKEGDAFNLIDDVEICTKYIIPTFHRTPSNQIRGQKKIFDRVEAKMFPEHLDAENYFRNIQNYTPFDFITVTQKLHGTSGRFGHIPVKRTLTLIDKLFRFLGGSPPEFEYDYVAGSRRVIKDLKTDREYTHYYESDIWNQWLENIKHLIPKNYIIYGEIIGWIGDKPIQKNYTYRYPKGQSELYVYRVSVINPDGLIVDLSWTALIEFCRKAGLKFVPFLWSGYHSEFQAEDFLDVRFQEELKIDCVPLDSESPCDEGVCIRKEGTLPYVTKAKSPRFLGHETKLLDKGETNIEDENS